MTGVSGFVHLPQRFPFVPPPRPDELLSSWVLRICAFYRLDVDWLDILVADTALATLPPGVGLSGFDIDPPVAIIERLANFTGYPPDTVRAQTLSSAYPNHVRGFFAVRSAHQIDVPLSWPGYCPFCLSEMSCSEDGAYLRREWALTYRTICHEHACFMRAFDGEGLWPGDFEWRHLGGAVILPALNPKRDNRRAIKPLPLPVATLITLEDKVNQAAQGHDVVLEEGLPPESAAALIIFVNDVRTLWGRRENGVATGAQVISQLAPLGFSPRGINSWNRGDALLAMDEGSHLYVRQRFLVTLATMLANIRGLNPFCDFEYFDFFLGFEALYATVDSPAEINTLWRRVSAWPMAFRRQAYEALDDRAHQLVHRYEYERMKRFARLEFALSHPRAESSKAILNAATYKEYEQLRDFWRGIENRQTVGEKQAEPQEEAKENKPSEPYRKMAEEILSSAEGQEALRLGSRRRRNALMRLARDKLDGNRGDHPPT